jgi:hypothetical protein
MLLHKGQNMPFDQAAKRDADMWTRLLSEMLTFDWQAVDSSIC